jgi:hypothetical protein
MLIFKLFGRMLLVLHYLNCKNMNTETKNSVTNLYKSSQYIKIMKEKSIKLHPHRQSQ